MIANVVTVPLSGSSTNSVERLAGGRIALRAAGKYTLPSLPVRAAQTACPPRARAGTCSPAGDAVCWISIGARRHLHGDRVAVVGRRPRVPPRSPSAK